VDLVLVTPPAIQNISWKFYIILGVFNTVCAITLYLFLVETRNKSLEDIDRYFAERYHGGEELRQVEQMVEVHYREEDKQGDSTVEGHLEHV
jgi:hypothetical protein